MESLRLLLWLKWTLTWRSYRSSRSKTAGAIIQLVFFLPLSGLGAYALHYLNADYPTLFFPLVRDTLAIVYLLWVMTPLLGFSLNESFDLTRLFIYPVTPASIYFGSLAGALLDRSILLVMPILVMLAVLSSSSVIACLIAIALLLLFLLQAIALGQALMLLLIGFLRSRRFRDITIVIFPLIGMSLYVGQRVFFRHLEEGTISMPSVIGAQSWHFATWLPPGWAALGLAAAKTGGIVQGLGMVVLLALATLAAGAVAVSALNNLYRGESGPARPQAIALSPRIGRSERKQAANLPLPQLPGVITAVAGKELLSLVRDPQYKALAVQSVYTLVWLAASFALPSLQSGSRYFVTGAPLLFEIGTAILLALLPLVFNIWAGEGAAVTALFSMPAPRGQLILGKNLAHGMLLLLVAIAGLFAAAAFSHSWSSLPVAGLWVVLSAPLLLAAGNLVSIRFPHRMLVRGQRWGRGGVATAHDDTGSGCAYSALYLLAYAGTFAAVLPVLAGVALPGLLGIARSWYLLTLPCAAVYSVGLYVILLRQATVWLLEREPEIIARIVPQT